MQGRDRHAAEAAANEVLFLAAYLMMRRIISQIGAASQELRSCTMSGRSVRDSFAQPFHPKASQSDKCKTILVGAQLLAEELRHSVIEWTSAPDQRDVPCVGVKAQSQLQRWGCPGKDWHSGDSSVRFLLHARGARRPRNNRRSARC